jgi:hypothetical protein
MVGPRSGLPGIEAAWICCEPDSADSLAIDIPGGSVIVIVIQRPSPECQLPCAIGPVDHGEVRWAQSWSEIYSLGIECRP